MRSSITFGSLEIPLFPRPAPLESAPAAVAAKRPAEDAGGSSTTQAKKARKTMSKRRAEAKARFERWGRVFYDPYSTTDESSTVGEAAAPAGPATPTATRVAPGRSTRPAASSPLLLEALPEWIQGATPERFSAAVLDVPAPARIDSALADEVLGPQGPRFARRAHAAVKGGPSPTLEYMRTQAAQRHWSQKDIALVTDLVQELPQHLTDTARRLIKALEAGDDAVRTEAWWAAQRHHSLTDRAQQGDRRLVDTWGDYIGVGFKAGKLAMMYAGRTGSFALRVVTGHVVNVSRGRQVRVDPSSVLTCSPLRRSGQGTPAHPADGASRRVVAGLNPRLIPNQCRRSQAPRPVFPPKPWPTGWSQQYRRHREAAGQPPRNERDR